MATRPSSASSSPTSQPVLVPQGRHAGKPNLPLSRPCIILGASSKSHFHLVSPTISKTHAAMIQTDIGVYIRDLASRTHVLVNGQKVREALLADGDIIALGAFSFLFRHKGNNSAIPKAAADGAISVVREPIPIPFEGRTMLIGRRPGSDIQLVEASVSNCHALIFEQNGVRWIRDLRSRTGTHINGRPVHQQQLEFDDEIRIGETEMRYFPAETAPTSDEIDELEDLVGTARLAEDDIVLAGDIGSASEEPDVPELEHVRAIPLANPPAKSVAPPARPAPPQRAVEPVVAAAASHTVPTPPAIEPSLEEPDEYELAPAAAAPVVINRPPVAAAPIPLEPIAPEPIPLEPIPLEPVDAEELPVEELPAEAGPPAHIASEAEIDLPPEEIPLEPLASEAPTLAGEAFNEPEPTTDVSSEPVSEHPSHLIFGGDEPPLAEVDLAAPDTPLEETVALDAAELTAEFTGEHAGEVSSSETHGESLAHPEAVAEEAHDPEPAHGAEVVAEAGAHEPPESEAVVDPAAHEESVAELEIPFAADASDQAFDDLIADELQPPAAAEQGEAHHDSSLHPEATSEEATDPEPAHGAEVVAEAGAHDERPYGPEVVAETGAHDEPPQSEAVVDLAAHEESVAELEIPFAADASDQAFDDLVADELHPQAAAEQGEAHNDSSLHPQAVAEEAHDPEPVHGGEVVGEAGAHDQPPQSEAVVDPALHEESVTELEIPFATDASDQAFDDLIADELHPQAAAEQGEAHHDSSLHPQAVTEAAHDLEPAHGAEVVAEAGAHVETPHAQAVVDPAAHEDSVAELEIPFASDAGDQAFDDLVADELHAAGAATEEQQPLQAAETHDTEIESFEPHAAELAPPVSQGDQLIAEAIQPASHESASDEQGTEPAHAEIAHAEPELESHPISADEDFDSLIAGALLPETESQFAETHEQEPEAEHALDAPPSADVDFDHLIAEAMQPTAEHESIDAEFTVTSSSVDPAPTVIDQTTAEAHEMAPADQTSDLFAADEPAGTLTSALSSTPDAGEHPETTTNTTAAAKSGGFSVFEEPAAADAPPARQPDAAGSTWGELGAEHDAAAPPSEVKEDFFDEVLDEMPAGDSAEVIEPTDPTPESAQTLATELPAVDATGGAGVIESASLTDSTFARDVSEFADPSPDPIVESESHPHAVAEQESDQPSNKDTNGDTLSDFDIDDIPHAGHSPQGDAEQEPELHALSADEEPGVLSDADVEDILGEASDIPGHEHADHAPGPQSGPVSGPVSGPASSRESGNGASHAMPVAGPPPVVTSSMSAEPPSAVTDSESIAGTEEFAEAVAPRVKRRFSFWPFGRKRAAAAPRASAETPAEAGQGELDADISNLDAGIDITPSDPSITVTSSATIDLAPEPATNISTSSSSPATASDVGEFLDELAPGDLLDAVPAAEDPGDSRAGALASVNFEPTDSQPAGPAPSAPSSWSETGLDDGLEFEPLSGGTAAAVAPVAPYAEADIVTDDAFEQPLAVDEVLADLPADAGELEIPVAEAMPEIDEPTLHVSSDPLGDFPHVELESALPVEFESETFGGSIETNLADSAADEFAAAEPAPVSLDSPGDALSSAEELSLELPTAAALHIDLSPAAFEPTEELAVAGSAELIEPLATTLLDNTPTEIAGLSDIALADAELQMLAPPEVSEIPASHFHPIEDIAIAQPPEPLAASSSNVLLIAEAVPENLDSLDVMVLADQVSEPISFTSQPAAPLELAPEPPLPWDQLDLESAGAAPHNTIDQASSDALLPLDFDAMQAPALAVNASELASVAAAAQEILSNPTPPPPPRAQPPAPAPQPPKPSIIRHIDPASFSEELPSAEVIASKVDEPIADLDFPAEPAVTQPEPEPAASTLSFDAESMGPDSMMGPESETPPSVSADLPTTTLPSTTAEQSLTEEQTLAGDFAEYAPPAVSPPVVSPPVADIVADQPQALISAPAELPAPSVDSPQGGGLIASPFDPFMGMTRDTGTFLGGMPLNLAAPTISVAPISPLPQLPPMPQRSSVFAPASDSVEPLAPAPEVAPDIVTADQVPDAAAFDSPALDSPGLGSDGLDPSVLDPSGLDSEESLTDLLAGEEPAEELFASSPESLDSLSDHSMGPIGDVVEVLGEAPQVSPAPAPPRSAAPAAPVHQSPASPVKPAVVPPSSRRPTHMPPRPRLTGRGRVTSPFDFGAQPGMDVVIPPFGGGAGSSSLSDLSGDFAGVPPHADSPDAFGARKGDKETVVPPVDPGQRGVGMLTALSASPPEGLATRVRSDAEIPRRPRGVGVPALEARPPAVAKPSPFKAPPRKPGPSPSPRFDGLPPIPPPAPVNLHLRVVLPIIVALALATAAAIWFFYHVSGTAEGRLSFDNLENLGPADKHNFELEEQRQLTVPANRNLALQIFDAANPGQSNAGFLGSGADADHAYTDVIAGAGLAPNGKDFVITAKNSADPAGDAKRLGALVVTLYQKNKVLTDMAARAKLAWEETDESVRTTKAQINDLNAILAEERAAAGQLDAAQQALAAANAQYDALSKASTEAYKKRQAAQALADGLETASPGAPAADDGALPDTAGTDVDPQIKLLSDQLTAANTSLARSRAMHSDAADAANKALDKALADFRASVDQAQGSLKDGSQLSLYLAAAQQAQNTIHEINADLVERQKTEQQRLSELRRMVSEKQEARLRAAWAADSQLQGMDLDLQVAEHRYNAAIGAGLDAETPRLKAEVETLKNKIDARRDLISTGDIFAEEVKQLQQFVDDSLKDMEAERSRADARMGDMLKALSAAAPKMDKLPADQQALEESLKKKLDEINNARQQQATAIAQSNPEADTSVRKLEGSITELQAKIDARRKELADVSHKKLTPQQSKDSAAKVAAAKAALTAALMAENDASLSARQKKVEADAAYSKTEELRAKSAKLKADEARRSLLESQLADLQAQSDKQLTAWHHYPVPQNPGTDGGARYATFDNWRLQWILISTLGYAILTVSMLAVWGISHRRHHQLLTQPASVDDFGDDLDDDLGDDFAAADLDASGMTDVLEDRSESSKPHDQF